LVVVDIRRGDFVLCNFPFREAAGPGPSPHIVLCAATGRANDTTFAIVFYTSTQTDYHGAKRPRQYIFVDSTSAARFGQNKAFHIDASRIARLPLTAQYFPELDRNTTPVKGRDADLVLKVEERLKELIATGFEVKRMDATRPKPK
jgi:hypothetical protein